MDYLSNKKVEELAHVFEHEVSYKSDSFLKSLPYFLLTGRKGYYFYRSGSSSLSVAIHPNLDNTFLVFPETADNAELTVQVLNNMYKEGKRVQLARYSENDYLKLLKALAKDPSSLVSGLIPQIEETLDWKYPNRILDCKKVANFESEKLKGLKKKFNKVAKEVEVLPLDHENAIGYMRSAVYFWLAARVELEPETSPEMVEFYETLIKHIQMFPSLFDGVIVRSKRETVGFKVWNITGDTANALAGIQRRSVHGLSEFMTITACQKLSDEGIKFFNYGGSETKGLDDFKCKFDPAKSESVRSFLVEYKDYSIRPDFEMP